MITIHPWRVQSALKEVNQALDIVEMLDSGLVDAPTAATALRELLHRARTEIKEVVSDGAVLPERTTCH
jgi:hypothetical protein